MKYEFLKIEYQGKQEVAYLLDTVAGKVIKVPVEGFSPISPSDNSSSSMIFDRVSSSTMGGSDSVVPSVFKNERPVVEAKPVQQEYPDKPKVRMPKEIGSMFVEGGMPGEATERRVV